MPKAKQMEDKRLMTFEELNNRRRASALMSLRNCRISPARRAVRPHRTSGAYQPLVIANDALSQLSHCPTTRAFLGLSECPTTLSMSMMVRNPSTLIHEAIPPPFNRYTAQTFRVSQRPLPFRQDMRNPSRNAIGKFPPIRRSLRNLSAGRARRRSRRTCQARCRNSSRRS